MVSNCLRWSVRLFLAFLVFLWGKWLRPRVRRVTDDLGHCNVAFHKPSHTHNL